MNKLFVYVLFAACVSLMFVGCSDKSSPEACLHQVTMDLDSGNYDAVLASSCAGAMQRGAAYFGKGGFDIKDVINRFSEANGIGGIASGRIDALTHQGFGADGFLETNADAIYGGLAGVSIGVTDNLYAGFSVKVLHRESLIHNFTAREFVENENNLDKYIEDKLRTSGDAVGADAGVLWKFAQNSPIKPSLGISVMNIGDLNFDRAGKMPQTANVGIAVNPTITMFRSLIVGLDYIDVLNDYKQDKDMAKRLRYGAELQLFDIWPVELALRAGMYESYPTFGVDLRLLFITASYAMYTEEVGAYAGQDKDKRQLLTLNIGW